ncbi:TIGR03619 family F420-dependent LLM class oxidoreductase [Novosphingobium sp. JCM 18896]|uniref:TIGR03619 family F420-dependent LLM class oxidoreductase n=1 Tax=Novosphingobium sp. JCM 18896 TaxID=2989731 RepID=UPI002221743E|nr:TIGR03619 family F420-dependent LLM class oxidoreductase [Novosphingobium sp. JCM 18896]MCW1429530.1 TIGR03619 family F420-dependent LLM class oxidoreductase [Novosphingobium sp. JCM 18896]
MRFSCSLPLDENTPGEFHTLGGIAEMVQAIDRAGLDGVFVTDHPAPSGRWLAGGGHATLDPFVALTAAAAASPRLQLQTHILVLAYRNPFVVAKAAASLDALAGGRLILGIGTGYLKPEYAAVGVSFDDRGAITDESIRILREAWTGEPVQHEGPRFTARDAVILPRPPRAEGIPIWAGGNAAPAIRRAVALCDGWSPFPVAGVVTKTARTDELSTIAHLKEKIAYARAYGEEIGRIKPLTICMGRLDGDALAPQDPAGVAQAIDAYGELAEAGVTWTTVALPSPSRAAFAENVQWFGEEIAAKVPR